MSKTNVKRDAARRIERSLQALSVGSYLHQCRVARELGLYPTDLQALHVVGAEGIAAGRLAEALGLTTGATTALIDRLESLGYVERARESADRRRVTVHVRRAGAGRIKAKYRSIDQRVRGALRRRSTSELGIVAEFLAEIAGPF